MRGGEDGSSAAHRRSNHRGGFTLIEAMVVMIIVGTGVLAIVGAQHAFHVQADQARKLSTALLLANEIRELAMNFPQHDPITGDSNWGPENNEPGITQYDDLDDLDGEGAGTTFNPPINALGQAIPNMAGWSQRIVVENVLPGNISTDAPEADASTPLMRITVTVFYQGPGDDEAREITRLTWVKASTPL